MKRLCLWIALGTLSACAVTVQSNGDDGGGHDVFDAAQTADAPRDAPGPEGFIRCNLALCPEGWVCAQPSPTGGGLPSLRCVPLPPGCRPMPGLPTNALCLPCVRQVCDRFCSGNGSRPACALSQTADD
jgi:hypothetical protein